MNWPDISWNKLPESPPVLDSLYSFPLTETVTQVCHFRLRNVHGDKHVILDPVVNVTAVWKKIFAVSCSPNTPFSKSFSVTSGTSSSQTTTDTFSVCLGVKSKLLDIGAKLSSITSQTISFKESVTEKKAFKVTPTAGQSSVIWWQPVYNFHLTGHEFWTSGGFVKSAKLIDSVITHYEKEFICRTYPKGTEVETTI